MKKVQAGKERAKKKRKLPASPDRGKKSKRKRKPGRRRGRRLGSGRDAIELNFDE